MIDKEFIIKSDHDPKTTLGLFEKEFKELPDVEWNIFNTLCEQDEAYAGSHLARGRMMYNTFELFSNSLKYWPLTKIEVFEDGSGDVRIEFLKIGYYTKVFQFVSLILLGISAVQVINEDGLKSITLVILALFVMVGIAVFARQSQINLKKEIIMLIADT